MKRISLIILIPLIFQQVCFAAEILEKGPFQYELPYQSQENFTYNISDCKNLPVNVKLLPQLNIYQEGGSLKFIHVLDSTCGAEKNLKLKYSSYGRDIEIREIFDADKIAECICTLDITGQIANLKKGKYNVKIIDEDRYRKQIKVIAEKEVELR